MWKLGDGSISISKFLEAYQQQPCLYNPQLETYKSRVAREGAYTAMIEALNIPQLSIHDIKRKIKSVRTVYSKELGTRRRFKEQGKPYDTKLIWFNLADSFLSNVSHSHGRNRKKTTAVNPGSRILFNATSDISMSEDAIEAAGGDETDDVSNTESTRRHPVARYTPDGRSIRQSSTPNASARRLTYDLTIDDSILEENPQAQEELTAQSQPNAQQQRKLFYNSSAAALGRSVQPESEQQVDPPAPALAPPPPVAVAAATPHPDDDMTHFGQSIGSQLRQITNPYSRSWAKLRIQQILFSAETGSFESSAGNLIEATNFTSPV
ncbi:uncharacterized protein LOC111072748 [Drosophila obscura]|uniref:uncharacterized protein LOC111072748 n=1 Tax=Drosophila obscura TaxID=7282 RepID=UPI001BB24348|nr:uncharacterized protein LOC111072748 [Drosophila obscura]XP_022220482.2 uncharacterized protein LOC111072748 [Drosophila obscura]